MSISAPKLISTHAIAILNSIREGVIVINQEKRIVFYNSAAEKISGISRKLKPQTHYCDSSFQHLTLDGRVLCGTDECPVQMGLNGTTTDLELVLLHKFGFRIPVSCKTYPLYDAQGVIKAAAQIIVDNRPVLDVLAGMEQAQKMALQDSLTGLGNRGFAEIHLQRSLLELDRYQSNFAVFFIDVDRFKQVNDSFGHETGDKILTMLGRELVTSVRASDVVARWGGEEFICILLHIDPLQVASLAEKLRAHIEDCSVPTEQGACKVTVSIGATMARSEDSVESLVNRADEYMYQSKMNGRNRVTFHLE